MVIVGAIRYVDKVVPQADMEKIRPVKELGADAVFVGSDWKGTDAWNQYEKEFARVGCTVVYLDHTDGISSSILREKLLRKNNNYYPHTMIAIQKEKICLNYPIEKNIQ